MEQCIESDNGLAHSIEEFSDQFAPSAMKAYYQISFNKYSTLYHSRFINPRMRCKHCKVEKFCYLDPVVVTHRLVDGVYILINPAIHINCYACGFINVVTIYYHTPIVFPITNKPI